MKNNILIPLTGLPLFLLMLGFLWYNNYDRTYSKFKVSDCVEVTYGSEFHEAVAYHKILKVGDKQYLVRVKSPRLEGQYLYDKTFEWKFYLNKYETVADQSLCEVE